MNPFLSIEMRTLSPPKDKENALTRAIVSLQTRIQKAIRKKNRSRQPENEPVAPALTSSEPYLVQAMACYPIAVGIAQYITRRDLLVLASSTPALSKILWSPVGSTEPSVDSALATRRPGKLVINFVEFERVISCIERLDARLLRLRLEQETVLTPREFCSEILDIRRQIEDLKCTGLFSTTHTSRPRSMLPPKASVPGVRKRSVSEPAKMGRMIYYDAPIEERGPTMVSAHDILTSVTAFPPYRSGQWEELSVLRLRALVNEMSDTYSTAANLFVIEYSHRRTLPYRFAISPRRCVCHDPFVYRCNHPGMHLGGASFPPEYLWKRQWWEPASKKWTLYIPPTNFKYELRALIGLGPDRWTRDMRDRVVQIMNYRINRREEPPGGETIDYQWQNLERYTSECEECGISAPNTRIVFKSLRNSIGELFKPHLLADDGFKADLAELERRVGTIECWGCNKVFCKFCLITVQIATSYWHMGQYVAHPHTFPRNGRGTHTQVCSRCFVRYFSPHSVFPPSEKREVRYRRKDGVGDTSKVLRISDLRVKWATTSILAPFCHILASRPCFSSRGQGVVSKLGVGAIVAGVPGWEVYGSNPLCLAWYKGPAY